MSSVIFTPDNEPYLGREHLHDFDRLLIICLEQNEQTAENSHSIILTDSQKMACQVISQAISIALSIRELIRQGYLFGAYVLVRSLFERAMILFYLHHFPEDIVHWNNGWLQSEAPGLSTMIDKVKKKIAYLPQTPARDMLYGMNSLLHAKPDSAYYNLVSLNNSRAVFAASKILNRPELCDQLCTDVVPTLLIICEITPEYF